VASPSHQLGEPEPQGTEDEKELAQAFKRGEPGAYEAIYARFQPRVHGVCRRMLSDPHDADEASQEAFLKVYQALPRFNGRYQLGAWIARITTNVCLDQLRSRSRKPSVPSTIEELDLELAEFQTEDGPEEFALRNAESRHVRRVLAGLPPMHRAAIVLRDFEGFSYEEVAKTLGISNAQCKALIHRARQNFKRSWNPSIVAALLPWRVVNRMLGRAKRLDAQATDQAARSAASLSDVAHVASSCSLAVQQCSAVLSDKVAGVVATVAIAAGSFAVGTQVTQPAAEHPARGNAAMVDLDQSSRPVAVAKKRSVSSKPKLDDKDVRGSVTTEPSDAGFQPDPDETQTPPPSEPTPEPEPSQTPPSSEGEVGGEAPPAVVPFKAYVGFDDGSGVGESAVTSQEATVDCGVKVVTQSMALSVWHDGEALPGRVMLSTGASAGFDLVISKNGTDYTYDAGAPSVTSTKNGDRLELNFAGSYSWVGNNPASANLPDSGRFSAKLTLDCSASRVITESISLFI
jgi:RNA polymerase sigma-70 factor, ECF subfamily